MSNFKVKSGTDLSTSSGNVLNSYIPTGTIIQVASLYNPSEAIQNGRCLCDGRAISRTTYSDLFNKLIMSYPVYNSSSTDFGLYNHTFSAGDEVFFTSTGTMPSGITSGTRYYIHSYTANTFAVTATNGGTIITHGSWTGSLSVNFSPYGLGDGTTTFNVPNMMENSGGSVFIYGSNTSLLNSSSLMTTGSNTHTHNTTISADGASNNIASTHTHATTIASANTNNPGNDHQHAMAINQSAFANPSGSRSRNDSTSRSAGLAHTHSLNAPSTGAPSYSTAHTHSLGNNQNASVISQSLHSHSSASNATTITTSSTSVDMQHMQMLYYIKL